MKNQSQSCERCGKEEHEAGREMDACVAELVMEWFLDGSSWFDEDGMFQNHAIKSSTYVYAFEPSTSIADAWEIENKIGELDEETQAAYISRLVDEVGIDESEFVWDGLAMVVYGQLWKLVRATPVQRCRAALKVVQG